MLRGAPAVRPARASSRDDAGTWTVRCTIEAALIVEQSANRRAAMRFGMGDRLGPRVFGHDHGEPFLGREAPRPRLQPTRVPELPTPLTPTVRGDMKSSGAGRHS
jgi:hypothetical protein